MGVHVQEGKHTETFKGCSFTVPKSTNRGLKREKVNSAILTPWNQTADAHTLRGQFSYVMLSSGTRHGGDHMPHGPLDDNQAKLIGRTEVP